MSGREVNLATRLNSPNKRQCFRQVLDHSLEVASLSDAHTLEGRETNCLSFSQRSGEGAQTERAGYESSDSAQSLADSASFLAM